MTRAVVFGAGQVGLPLAELLSWRGHDVDDRRFRERFDIVGTPLADGARATVEWARSTFT